MDWFHFMGATIDGLEKIFFLCAIGLIIEYFLPAEENQPAKTILFNLIWIVNFLIVTNILMHYLGAIVPKAAEAMGGPWVDLNLPDTWWAWMIHLGIFIVMYDFGYYWFHRCQHSWSWFWCHHKLHHTDEHMNATTSFRHHWLENVYRIPFILTPMALFVSIDSTMPVIFFDLMLVWAIFTHLNLRLEMGPLTSVLAGPQVHRIHHSKLPVHKDRNFAAYFPGWDIMFGTYHKPAKGEFPDCGTVDGETTWSIWEANVGVFKGWYGLMANRLAAGEKRRALEAD